MRQEYETIRKMMNYEEVSDDVTMTYGGFVSEIAFALYWMLVYVKIDILDWFEYSFSRIHYIKNRGLNYKVKYTGLFFGRYYDDEVILKKEQVDDMLTRIAEQSNIKYINVSIFNNSLFCLDLIDNSKQLIDTLEYPIYTSDTEFVKVGMKIETFKKLFK